MSNLDNLTSKILNDAKTKADEIIKAAQKMAAEKYKKEIEKYNSQKASLEESAVRDRDLTVERIKSGASLKVRNEKLKAKQQVIDKVINRLREKLLNMDEVEYIDYMKKNLDNSSLNKNQKLIVKKEFLGKVKKEFTNANISETEFVNSGFILEENGVQENYTFEVKLEFMRDDLEVQISQLLFS